MDKLLNLCDKTRSLLHGAATSDTAMQTFFKSAIEYMRQTEGMLRARGDSVVAFCGKTNVGKSTLMNALLGEKIAPVRNCDWSARPVEYTYSGIPALLIADKYPPVKREFSNDDELSSALKDLTTMANPSLAVGQEHLVVQADFPILRDGLIICDMPGFLAATGDETEEKEGVHDFDIKEYLRKNGSFLQIYLISNAQLPDQSVIRFIRENLIDHPLTVVINYRESDDIEQRKRQLESSWGGALDRVLDFYYINAKKSCRQENDELNKLTSHIKRRSATTNREAAACEDLVNLYRNLYSYLFEFNHFESVRSIFPPTRIGVVRQLAYEYGEPSLVKAVERICVEK